jgi:hypothetical protein
MPIVQHKQTLPDNMADGLGISRDKLVESVPMPLVKGEQALPDSITDGLGIPRGTLSNSVPMPTVKNDFPDNVKEFAKGLEMAKSGTEITDLAPKVPSAPLNTTTLPSPAEARDR